MFIVVPYLVYNITQKVTVCFGVYTVWMWLFAFPNSRVLADADGQNPCATASRPVDDCKSNRQLLSTGLSSRQQSLVASADEMW